jgi:hypothetical protein
MSRYADALEHLLRVFPEGAVRTWWYDDLIGDEERTLTEIHAFLGLAPASTQEPLSAGRVNASGTPRRPWMAAGMQVASRSATLRRVVKAVVPFEARERIRSSNLAATDVAPDIVKELAPRFSDDLERLQDVLSTPVPAHWRR